MDEKGVREIVSELGYVQGKRHQGVLRRVGSRNSGSARSMEAFEAGDYLEVRKVPKSVVIWTGP